jgi:predicted O-methyltransferase YrrM
MKPQGADVSADRWIQVDDYVSETLIAPDAMLDAALKASVIAGLPSIQVTPSQGKLLHLLAKIQGARAILEIGTLGGYSTIWLARALPAGGKLITLELDPRHAEVARANFARAKLTDRIELRLGPALETLPHLAKENRGPFDMIFIDADKAAIPEYFDWGLKLSRAGTIIIADNVVRSGGLAEASSKDPAIQGVRRFHRMLAAEPRVSATTVQTVGSKGYDGFTLALVTQT